MNNVNYDPLNPSALQVNAQDKLRERLSEAPWLKEIKVSVPAPKDAAQLDIIAQFLSEAGPAALAVLLKRQVKPGDVPKIQLQLGKRIQPLRAVLKGEILPMVAAPWISPRVADLCRQAKIGWMDLAGNMFLSAPGIHLHYAGFPNPIKPGRPAASLHSAESARVIRALLCRPQELWTQWKLLEACNPSVSIGLVNKVVQYLRDEAFLEENEFDGFKVKDPVGLLKAWAKAYRFNKHLRRGYFTLLQAQVLMKQLGYYATHHMHTTALACFSAADYQAPHVRQPKTWVYVRKDVLAGFLEMMEAKPVDSGANMEVLVPADSGVFYEIRNIGNEQLPQTHPVQTYVDLCHCGGRGEEAAEALLEQRLKPEWKARGFEV